MNEIDVLTQLAINSKVWVEVAEDLRVPSQLDGEGYSYPKWSVDPEVIAREFEAGRILKAKRRRADKVMTVVVKKASNRFSPNR